MKSRHQGINLNLTVMTYMLLALSLLTLIGFSRMARAEPPATVASCAGIKEAYPYLGRECEKHYHAINHAPDDANERITTFYARISVLKIFRKALLCNGMYGATKRDQQRFLSHERTHLIALSNLRTNMENSGDPTIPPEFDRSDLADISITKKQCKRQ